MRGKRQSEEREERDGEIQVSEGKETVRGESSRQRQGHSEGSERGGE